MDLGLRQSDIARTLGVWTSTLNSWENNRHSPHVRHVPRIVTFLGYDPFPVPPEAFSARLKAARIAAGLTRRQLAAWLGVHPGTVAEWERGEKCPGRDSVDRLRRVFPSAVDA
jgi:transcriptional regulator with XRE-family HTH domain